MGKKAFFWQVYEVVGQIPSGNVATYGQIAALLGTPQRARMVGQALSHTPSFLGLPCHRVVSSIGRTAPHWHQQRQLLEAEGIPFGTNGMVILALCRWHPKKEPACREE